MQFYILALQGHINTRTSGAVDTQRLSGLRCLLRKRASVNGYPIEWLVSFACSQHLTNGHCAMQFRILARQCRVNAYALARWTHSVFRACGVSYASFLLSAARCLIEYVHVYTLHKLPSI